MSWMLWKHANGLRQLADSLSQKLSSGVVVLGLENEGKLSFVVRVTDDWTTRLNAGQIVKKVAGIAGGKGGGRADMATGGGPETIKLKEAIAASGQIVEAFVVGNEN